MIYKISAKDSLCATVKLPASKSISNRVLIINALSYSPYPIQNLSDCDDTNVLLAALDSDSNRFDIGAAGTAMRFLTAFLAKIVGEWEITGTERMKNRPIRLLVDALNKLGGKIEYIEKEGFPPLRIFGSSLQGGEMELEGSVSSQYISALLMVAPAMENGLVLRLKGEIISKPYIHLTLRLLSDFGITAEWTNNTIRIKPQEFIPKPFVVESDWSAASYWYQMAALSRSNYSLSLTGLQKNSYQGDAEVANLFTQLGVETKFNPEGVVLQKRDGLCKKMIYNFVNQPDLAQTFVVTCCLLNVPFYFSGLQSLKIKETDRILALKTEMKKLGFLIQDKNDSVLEWNGERCDAESSPVIATYEDHRMAMAFAPAALSLGEISIADPGVVSKSYPYYWEDLSKAGFSVSEETI